MRLARLGLVVFASAAVGLAAGLYLASPRSPVLPLVARSPMAQALVCDPAGPRPLTSPALAAPPPGPSDAAQRLADALRDPALAQRSAVLRELAYEVLPKDVPALLPSVLELENLRQRSDLTEILIARWAEADPGAALDQAKDLAPPRLERSATLGALESWSLEDPVAAVNWLEVQGADLDRTVRREALLGLVPSLAEKDPGRALALAASMGPDAPYGVRAVMQTFAAAAPAEAVLAYEREANPRLKEEMRQALVEGWADNDPLEALRWSMGLEDPAERVAALSAALGPSAELDPQTALRSFEALAPEERGELAGILAETWAEADPQAVLTWARRLDRNDPSRSEAFRALVYRLSDDDPAAALELVGELPQEDRFNAAYSIGVTLGQEDPAAAIEKLRSVGDEEVARAGVVAALSSWAEVDPEAAARAVLALSPAEGRDEVVGAVGRAWAANEPQAAADWLASLPPGATRDHAVEGAMPVLALMAPEEARRLAETTSGELREDVIATLAGIWANDDPAAAASWLVGLPDAGSTLESVLSDWREQHPLAFQAWLSDLDSNQAARARGTLDQLALSSAFDPEHHPEDETAPDGACPCVCATTRTR